MTTPDPARAFQSLLKKLRAKHECGDMPSTCADPALAGAALLEQLIFDFMLWESSTAQAKAAVKKLGEIFVDHNELRVAMPHEIAAALGDRCPLALDRSLRLRSTLQDLYKREHIITLAPVAVAAKREARQYLESLDGMPSFVAARLTLFGMGGHAIPADYRLIELLRNAKALPADADSPAHASSWLERHVKANDAPASVWALQAWSDAEGQSPKHDLSTGLILIAPPAIDAPKRPRSKRTVRGVATRVKGRSP